MRVARLHASWTAAFLVTLAMPPGPAAAKCAQDSIRVYPAIQQRDVPVDVALILELPAAHPVLPHLLHGDDAVHLVAEQLGPVAARPVRHSGPAPSAKPARVTVELRPATELQPDTAYRLDWQGWRDVPSQLRNYGFVTGSRRSARISGQPKVSTPVFWLSKPGCGAQMAFSLDVLGPDPTGVHEVQISATPATLAGGEPTARSLLGSFLEVQGAGRLTVGAAACRSNYPFKLRWRGWARVRVLAENGDPSPWSAPFELEADPDGLHAKRTCPPQS